MRLPDVILGAGCWTGGKRYKPGWYRVFAPLSVRTGVLYFIREKTWVKEIFIMTGILKVVMRNEDTALPRILRVINRQGFALRKLAMQPCEDERYLEIQMALDCPEIPLRLVRLLQKQVPVFAVQVQPPSIQMAV